VTSSGRVRVDAIARYLQDIARDDSADSGLPNPMGWVVRRTVIEVRQAPVFQERVELATWCSGVGARWAERRTTVAGEQGGLVETATIWVHVDPERGRPARLGPEFAALYGDTAAGRKVDARLAHPTEPPPGAIVRPWPWRATDFDVLAHVNNAAYAETVEEALAAEAAGPPTIDGCRIELEYRDPALVGSVATWALARSDDGLGLWLLADDRLAFTAQLERGGSGSLPA
jgi:acyl-ACP thioesterase